MSEEQMRVLLRTQIPSGPITKPLAEAILHHLDRRRPGSLGTTGRRPRGVFVRAACELGESNLTGERIPLHEMVSGSPERASGDYERLIAARPEEAQALLRRKAGLFGIVDPAIGLEAYHRLLAIEPVDDRVRLDHAALLASVGRWSEAAEACRGIVARSEHSAVVREAAMLLEPILLMIRLEVLSAWAQRAAARLLPWITERMPWFGEEVERDGSLGWDAHAAIALCVWAIDGVGANQPDRTVPIIGLTVPALAEAVIAVVPNRDPLPPELTPDRNTAFREWWDASAPGALRDALASFGPDSVSGRADNRITSTGSWVLSAYAVGDLEFEDYWLVGDAISTLGRRFLQPADAE